VTLLVFDPLTASARQTTKSNFKLSCLGAREFIHYNSRLKLLELLRLPKLSPIHKFETFFHLQNKLPQEEQKLQNYKQLSSSMN
jgi:hypothetical protein